jgi:hypothetical protein
LSKSASLRPFWNWTRLRAIAKLLRKQYVRYLFYSQTLADASA